MPESDSGMLWAFVFHCLGMQNRRVEPGHKHTEITAKSQQYGTQQEKQWLGLHNGRLTVIEKHDKRVQPSHKHMGTAGEVVTWSQRGHIGQAGLQQQCGPPSCRPGPAPSCAGPVGIAPTTLSPSPTSFQNGCCYCCCCHAALC